MGQLGVCIFVIIPEFYDSEKGYELGIVWPGYLGVYSTDYFCGHDMDLAIEWANNLNQRQGINPTWSRAILEASIGIHKIPVFYKA